VIAALAPRALLIGTYGGQAVTVAAAAATTGDNGVKTTIITGLFAIIAAMIGAASLLIRRRGPDIDDLLEVHERLAVIETNQADMREDVRTILHRLERHGD
jgi:hypothetical protein